MNINKIYQNRPFKVRNADEYDLENILDLFVDPMDGLSTPFDYENAIIKGKMGSGKTMYLRANYAYYSFTMVPSLLENNSIVIPIYIKMSDFQTIKNPEDIYSKILIKILEEMTAACSSFESAEYLSKLHKGFQNVNIVASFFKEGVKRNIERLKKVTAEEYIETVGNTFKATGKCGNKLLTASADYSRNVITELKGKESVTFDDIVDAYNELYQKINGKILLLFDEVGSLNRNFLKETEQSSCFESLMNQFRTLSFVRTKIAIYPNSVSDILTETRYGDMIELENMISENQYSSFLNRTIALIDNYLQKDAREICRAEDIFDMSAEDMDVIEQIVNASNGNMRRLVHLLDMSMNNAYRRNNGNGKVNMIDVVVTLKEQAQRIEALFTVSERELLSDIASVCRSRATYRFSFPNKSVSLIKYTSKSAEYNIVNLVESGIGRKSSIYEFDYVYCVYKDIPTHYLKNTERLDKSRARKTGDRIRKVTKITDELIEQAVIPGKIEGKIAYLNSERTSGFINAENGKEYFISKEWIIEDDRNKSLKVGATIRFIPVRYTDTDYARELEVL